MSNKKVTVKRIQLDHVLAHDKVLYNTNNHWAEQKIDRPEDYETVLSMGNTKNWIDLFHKDDYFTITFDEKDMFWMGGASVIGMVTRRFSHIYDDELQATCKKYEGMIPPGKYFIRSERVSLKNGMHGIGPYNSIKNIIESIVTGTPGHEFFTPSDKLGTVYFMRWLDLDPEKEFRIFVYNNDITALSAQHLYTINNWLNTLSDEQISEKVNKIVDYFNKNIKEKMSYMTNYVMDLALIGPEETPYFIEANSFGKYYSAGSALYHWIYDHDKIHDSSELEMRYVNEY